MEWLYLIALFVLALLLWGRRLFRLFVGYRCNCGKGRLRYWSSFSDHTVYKGKLAPCGRFFWKCGACGAVREQNRRGLWVKENDGKQLQVTDD
jgi:hypothetical protein